MWDSDGGGSTNHKGSSPIGRISFINPEIIPEYSGLISLLFLIIIVFPLIIQKTMKNKGKKSRINLLRIFIY